MFKLVAMIFAMVNGAPSDQPVRSLAYNQTFETLEACMEFGGTDEGLALRNVVNEYVMSQRGAVMARMGCVQEQDNTI